MLPDSPCPRAALALSDLQPQTGASTFAVGTGSGNWSTHGVGGVGGDASFDNHGNGGLFGGNRQNDRPFDSFSNSGFFDNKGCGCTSYPTVLTLSLLIICVSPIVRGDVKLPECHSLPKVLCCTERVLEKCLSGCIDYVMEKCPHKLDKYETIEDKEQKDDKKSELVKQKFNVRGTLPLAESPATEKFVDQEIRRAPSSGDAKTLSHEFPITEISDSDLTSECGTERSRPPYSPCLSRKTVDDLFLSCCQQHVPASCHSLCTYEHREHVAAETLIAAVQQDGCDLKYLSNILYCANQNRDNRPCCEFLGMSNSDLGVGDRCLRMCNVAPSGDRINSVEKNDLVCLSNWNVVMYCARSGLRTIN
ncbi:unnamed protein product [Auanema sp. JU1783]|nr:unnamed protein product [Auanema sp. JU1783]